MKKSVFVCLIFAAGVVTVTGENFECDTYSPTDVCTMDAILFCLTNGTVIIGRCHARSAVCAEQKTVDPTFAACRQSDKDRFVCDHESVCTLDLFPFCLNNGTVVRGSCRAKQAVCEEGKSIVKDFSACNRAAAGNLNKQTGDGNSADTVSAATISLLVGLLFSFGL